MNVFTKVCTAEIIVTEEKVPDQLLQQSLEPLGCVKTFVRMNVKYIQVLLYSVNERMHSLTTAVSI